MSVEELADESGSSPSSIYKMEANPKVRWQTVERAYATRFHSPQDHCTTLILWALQQTNRKIALYEAAETAQGILREEKHEMDEGAEKILSVLRRLSPVSATRLIEFCTRYGSEEPTRNLVAAWLSATKP